MDSTISGGINPNRFLFTFLDKASFQAENHKFIPLNSLNIILSYYEFHNARFTQLANFIMLVLLSLRIS